MDIEVNQQHICQECGMKFFHAHELVNHTKKFCSGLNSLEALENYQNKNLSLFSKNKKIQGYKSQNVVKINPDHYSPSALERDVKELQKHKEDLSINRPYTNAYSPKLYQSKKNSTSNVSSFQYNIRPNSMAKNGSRILGDSEVSMKPLDRFQERKNPTSLAHVKLPEVTVLNKSNTSIANMTKSQKQQYVNVKLMQLDQIGEMYDKSGGGNKDFKKNIQKMQKFYKKMLQQEPKSNLEFYESRVQTPIYKLRQDNLKKQSESLKNTALYDTLDDQLIKTASKHNFQQENKKSKKKQTQPYIYPPPYPIYQPPQQPQIIMMPPYQLPQPNPQTNQLKYLQKMMQLKNEENKRLMQMIVKSRDEKQNFKKTLTQIHKSRLSQKDDHIYHAEQPLERTQQLTVEERILISLQRQELDELKLLSTLPQQLQQIKMQSVMKLIETRTEIQKQVIKQKIQRLEQQQRDQEIDENRKFENEKWVDKERKRYMIEEMKNQYKNEDQGQYSDQQQYDG